MTDKEKVQLEKKRRYCIVFVRVTEQQRLADIIREHMPKERGEVFIPRMEYYRRGEKEVKIKPIFPGYVFLHTDMDIREVHLLIQEVKARQHTGARELRLAAERMLDENTLYDENEIYDLSDVESWEEEFLDRLREGNGLLTMSSGYEYDAEGGSRKKGIKPVKKYKVMEGPLQVYEDRIRSVDKHNRKAFLEFEINGRQAQAGFNCLPKACWVKEEDTRLATLENGTVVDLEELKKSLMVIK